MGSLKLYKNLPLLDFTSINAINNVAVTNYCKWLKLEIPF